MARSGTLIEVTADRFFLREVVVNWAVAAKALADRTPDKEFAAAAFRDEIKSGRTVAIQVLEYFDRHGFTLRRGDLRRVAKNPHHTFGGADQALHAGEEGNRPRWDVRTSNPDRAASQF